KSSITIRKWSAGCWPRMRQPCSRSSSLRAAPLAGKHPIYPPWKCCLGTTNTPTRGKRYCAATATIVSCHPDYGGTAMTHTITHAGAQAQYDEFKKLGLILDMSRGKPSPEQLDLSNALLGAMDGYKAGD